MKMHMKMDTQKKITMNTMMVIQDADWYGNDDEDEDGDGYSYEDDDGQRDALDMEIELNCNLLQSKLGFQLNHPRLDL